MTKKHLMVLVLLVFVAGWSFAQVDFEAMAKNTITVDFGPTIIGGIVGAAGELMNDEEGIGSIDSSGFGIGAQYERQLLRQLSVAGRFAYMGFTIEVTSKQDNIVAIAETKLSSFSIEGHVRYYPFGETFFLDGMLGYANLSLGISGKVFYNDLSGTLQTGHVSRTVSRDYFKLGAKLGWRISVGSNGGFTFEPAIGYYGGIASGDTIGQKLINSINIGDAEIDEYMNEFEEAFASLENYVFVGGPRITLAFGWRF